MLSTIEVGELETFCLRNGMSFPGDNIYQVLLRPLVTEKSSLASAYANMTVFEVHPQANKNEIKRAVEKAFSVKVKSVRTQNVPGKLKRIRNRVGHQKSWKKAYVKLAEGETIDLVDGL